MHIDNKSAYLFYNESISHLAKTTGKAAKIKVSVDRFMLTYKIEASESKNIYTRFAYLLEHKPANKSSAEILTEWGNKYFFVVHPAVGRPRKSLGDGPCSKLSKSILHEQVVLLEKFADEQNISKEKALEMLNAECARYWKLKSKCEKATLPELDATALVYNMNLSLPQYQLLRTTCLPHNIEFPPRNKIDIVKKTLHPTIKSQELRASVSMKDLLAETATSILKVTDVKPELGDSYTVTGKFGLDTSGGHKIRQQLVNAETVLEETPHLDPTRVSSFLLACYCPLELRSVDKCIWKNPVPNSTAFARPVSLARANEERGVLLEEMKDPMSVLGSVYEAVIGKKNLSVHKFFGTPSFRSL